jgi:hypothetical protein
VVVIAAERPAAAIAAAEVAHRKAIVVGEAEVTPAEAMAVAAEPP